MLVVLTETYCNKVNFSCGLLVWHSDTEDRDGQFMVDYNIWHRKPYKGISFLGLVGTRYLAWFQASATAQMRSSLFWSVTRRGFILSHRRLWTIYRSHLGWVVFLDSLTLEDGTDRLSPKVGNSPEERIPLVEVVIWVTGSEVLTTWQGHQLRERRGGRQNHYFKWHIISCLKHIDFDKCGGLVLK